MVDFSMLMKLRPMLDAFKGNHPKMAETVANVRGKGFCEGQEIAIAVRYPDGTEYKAGIRVTQEDLQLLNGLKGML